MFLLSLFLSALSLTEQFSRPAAYTTHTHTYTHNKYIAPTSHESMAAWIHTGRNPYSSLISPPCFGTDVLAAASMRERTRMKNERPGSAAVLQEFRSFKHLTVADLKTDPALTAALRSLHAAVHSGRPQTAHVDMFSLRPSTSSARVLTRPDIAEIRSVTPAAVSRDPVLKSSLQILRARTDRLGTARSAARFSAVGEASRVAREIRALGLPYTPHAGLDTIASAGPGWIGPHRVMESHRRPRGPANV